MTTYEVILSNIVLAADNPVEAAVQFCLIHGITDMDFTFLVRELDVELSFTGKEFEINPLESETEDESSLS